MTVRVRSVPPCVSSQIGSRHLPLKQGIVSSSLTWRTNSIGVWCNASIRVLGTRGDSSTLSSPTKRKFRISDCELRIWFASPRPDFSRLDLSRGVFKSEIRNPKFLAAPVAQLEERDASNVEVAGSSPARSSIRRQINDLTPQPKGAGYSDLRQKKAQLTTCAIRGSDVAGNM